MQEPKEWVSGNIMIRPMEQLALDAPIIGHDHHFDHTTICMYGSVLIEAEIDGRKVSRTLHAPSPEYGAKRAHCLIKAGVHHKITALEPGTIAWCVYSHRTPQGEVVQEFTGWELAYGVRE